MTWKYFFGDKTLELYHSLLGSSLRQAISSGIVMAPGNFQLICIFQNYLTETERP